MTLKFYFAIKTTISNYAALEDWVDGSITEQKKDMSEKDMYKKDGSFLDSSKNDMSFLYMSFIDDLLKCYSQVLFEKLYNNKIYLNSI